MYILTFETRFKLDFIICFVHIIVNSFYSNLFFLGILYIIQGVFGADLPGYLVKTDKIKIGFTCLSYHRIPRPKRISNISFAAFLMRVRYIQYRHIFPVIFSFIFLSNSFSKMI